MSNSNSTRPSSVSGTVVAVCITVLACFGLAICAAIFIAVPDGARSGSMVVILLGALGPAIAALAALVGVRQVRNHVYELKDGLLDAKVRAGIADVLPDSLIDPAIKDQLVADRDRRDRASAEVHGTLS